MLSGSPADIDPSLFRASRHPETAAADPDRERTDFGLLEHFLRRLKPILAICYGIQSLNVFLGGTLVQDIPSELGKAIQHDWEDEKGDPEPFHAARVESGSRLAQIAGVSDIYVNSSHHQSVAEPGRKLRIVSRAPDGVVEAVEAHRHTNWVVGRAMASRAHGANGRAGAGSVPRPDRSRRREEKDRARLSGGPSRLQRERLRLHIFASRLGDS